MKTLIIQTETQNLGEPNNPDNFEFEDDYSQDNWFQKPTPEFLPCDVQVDASDAECPSPLALDPDTRPYSGEASPGTPSCIYDTDVDLTENLDSASDAIDCDLDILEIDPTDSEDERPRGEQSIISE